MKLTKGRLSVVLIIVFLLVDQISKILVKTNMTIGESIPVFGNWFQILFIENNGMAFGMHLGGEFGKFLLTFLRIVFSVFVIIFLRKLVKSPASSKGLVAGVSLVLVGAIGNIIDSLLYGVLFGVSTPSVVAEFLPDGGGYAPVFFGKVVDMLYFPIIDSTWPEWMPFVGGEDFVFFSPVFNIADSCITVGILYLIIFQWKNLSRFLK